MDQTGARREVRGPLRRLQLSPFPGVIQQEGTAQPFPSPFSSFFALFLSHVPLLGLQSLSDELQGALHGCLAAPTRLFYLAPSGKNAEE